MNGIDISTGTAPTPASGLISGVTQGLNMGQLIQEGRARRQQEDQQLEAKKQQAAHQKMIDGLGLIKESWVPPDYKIMLYNQNVKPYFADSSVPMPDLKEWPSFGDKASKELHDIVTKGKKQGLAPQEIETMAALALSKYEPEFQKQGQPVLESLKNEGTMKIAQQKADQAGKEKTQKSSAFMQKEQLNLDSQMKNMEVVKDMLFGPADETGKRTGGTVAGPAGKVAEMSGKYTGGTVGQKEKLYHDFKGGMAVALYRGVTGDTRVGDRDAELRAYTMLPDNSEPRSMQLRKIQVIDQLLAKRRSLFSQAPEGVDPAVHAEKTGTPYGDVMKLISGKGTLPEATASSVDQAPTGTIKTAADLLKKYQGGK